MAPPDPCCAMPLCAMLLSLSSVCVSLSVEKVFVCRHKRDEKKNGGNAAHMLERGGAWFALSPRAFVLFGLTRNARECTRSY